MNRWGLLIFALILAQIPLAADYSLPDAKGPIHFAGQTPLQTLRLDIVPTRYLILSPGQWELSFFNSVTNRWNATDFYLLDVETTQNILSFSIGLKKRLEIGAILPILTISGGQLDRFIAKFHDTFGLDQAGRTKYPFNALQISVTREDGQQEVLISADDRGTSLGDISIYSHSLLYRGEDFLKSVMLTTLVRFPTSSERRLYGTGGTDGALSLSAMYRAWQLYFYTTLGYGIYGRGSSGGIALKSHQWTFFGAVEYPVSEKFSLIIQQLSNSGVAHNFYEFSQPTHELTLGAKNRISRNLLLEYGVVENVFSFRNSIDFGISFGLTWLK